jgi:hypothetical protein
MERDFNPLPLPGSVLYRRRQDKAAAGKRLLRHPEYSPSDMLGVVREFVLLW